MRATTWDEMSGRVKHRVRSSDRSVVGRVEASARAHKKRIDSIMSTSNTIEKFQEYFAMFDGHPRDLSTDEVDAKIRSVFDPSLVIHTPHGDEDYKSLVANVRHHLAQGTTVTRGPFVSHPKGVEYTVRVQEADGEEPLCLHSVGTVENGRIVQIDPLEYGESYDVLLIPRK